MSWKTAPNLLYNVEAQSRARVEHRKHSPSHPETWVQLRLHQLYDLQKLGKSLKRIVFALDWNQHCLGRREGIYGQYPQGGAGVHNNEVVAIPGLGQALPQPKLPCNRVGERQISRRQVYGGRTDKEAGNLSLNHYFRKELGRFGWVCCHNHVENRTADAQAVNTETAGGVALGVEVNQKHHPAVEGCTCCQVHSRCGLPDTSLLVHNGIHCTHALTPLLHTIHNLFHKNLYHAGSRIPPQPTDSGQ